MLIVKVTFQIPKDMDLKTLKGSFRKTAPMYRDTKGLIRKNYICDLDKSIGVVFTALKVERMLIHGLMKREFGG